MKKKMSIFIFFKEEIYGNLLDVYKNHAEKVSHKWIHIFPIYASYISEISRKGNPITILAIGVSNGGSFEIWEKYLPKHSQVHGIDIKIILC